MFMCNRCGSIWEDHVCVPAIYSIIGVDAPRARRSDPVTSHRAADKSAESLTKVQAAVVELVGRHTSLSGSQINYIYSSHRDEKGWPFVAWDTPRKRAGELAAAGRMVILNEGDPRGTERIYGLPVENKEEAA